MRDCEKRLMIGYDNFWSTVLKRRRLARIVSVVIVSAALMTTSIGSSRAVTVVPGTSVIPTSPVAEPVSTATTSTPSSPAPSGAAASQPAAPQPAAPQPSATARSNEAPVWKGPIEHVFFHPLVRRPDLAFRGPSGRGFRDYFITVDEFRKMIDQMYRNNWVLVDMRAALSGTLRVPVGKRPLVISIDDLNYYDYMRQVGGAWKLVVVDGRVRLEVHEPRFTQIRYTDEEIVPILDDFVASHPDFSIDGAKAVIALTGFEGVLGERVRTDPGAAARARAVASILKSTGWRFASHSYGHIPINERSMARVRSDAARWRTVVESVVGPTEIFIYPFGKAVPPGSAIESMLRKEFGFTVFCDIGSPVITQGRGWVRFPRRHIDGIAFEQQPNTMSRFFSVNEVVDWTSRRA